MSPQHVVHFGCCKHSAVACSQHRAKQNKARAVLVSIDKVCVPRCCTTIKWMHQWWHYSCSHVPLCATWQEVYMISGAPTLTCGDLTLYGF